MKRNKKAIVSSGQTMKPFPVKSILSNPPNVDESKQLMSGGIFGDEELGLLPDEEIATLQKKISKAYQNACSMVVSNQGEYDGAGDFKEMCNGIDKEVDEKLDPGRDYLHKIWKHSKLIIDQIKQNLDIAISLAKGKRGEWKTADEKEKARQNRLAEIEAARLEREAVGKAAEKAREYRDNNQEAKAEKVEEKVKTKTFIPNIQREAETRWRWNVYNFNLEELLREAFKPGSEIKLKFSALNINKSEITRQAELAGEGKNDWGIVKKEQVG